MKIKYKEEIDKIIESGQRFKHMNINDLKDFPRLYSKVKKVLKELQEGKISFDEANGVFGYSLGDAVEWAYGSDGYDYYMEMSK